MKIVVLILLLPLQLFAQDFTGIWTGYLTVEDTRLPYELVISSKENNLKSYSLTVFSFAGNEHTGIKTIKIKIKKDDLAIEDDELIYNDYTMPSKKVRLYGRLSFDKSSFTILRGTFFTRSVDRTSFNGTIYLERKDDLAKTKLISFLEKMNLSADLFFQTPKTVEQDKKITTSNERIKDSLPMNESALQREETTIHAKERGELVSLPIQKKPVILSVPAGSNPPIVKVNKTVIKSFEAAAELASRKTEILRSIYFESDSLVLSLYDNGEIDGDTVSVLVNDQIVIARRGLTGSAIKTTVYTPPGSIDSLQVIMYAENLGRIAPNTGLLIIEDGAEKYQVRFEGDFKKNSAVVFRRKQ